jgi:two-component system cell cycle response regulator DivK
VKTILVADDNPVSRELVVDILENTGYRILEARDGREALDVVARDRPDLVLLDIQMPHADGYAVVSAIRSDPRLSPVRVVAVTAFAMDSDREKARQAGFDGFVTKPIDIEALRKMIDSFLG